MDEHLLHAAPQLAVLADLKCEVMEVAVDEPIDQQVLPEVLVPVGGSALAWKCGASWACRWLMALRDGLVKSWHLCLQESSLEERTKSILQLNPEN